MIWSLGNGEIARPQQQHPRHHAVRVRAEAAWHPEVLYQDPVGEAEDGRGRHGDAQHPRPAGQQRQPRQGQGDDREQVHRQSVRAGEPCERRNDGLLGVRLGEPSHA